MKLLLVFMVALLLFSQREVFASEGIIINEVAWMGTVPMEGESTLAASNNEWVELKNLGSMAQSLDGWTLGAADGSPAIVLSGTISAGSYFLLERGNDDVIPSLAADIVFPFKNNALSNGGEHLFLKNASGAVVDELDASSGWPAGDNATKETMQKKGSTWVSAAATPRAQNFPSDAPAPAPAPGGSPAQSSGSPGTPPSAFPLISAYAGDDRNAVAGSEMLFTGEALGSLGKPLEGARFLWNFGDGTAKEGRALYHSFQIPGTYTVGLHVSTGSYVASDYLSVRVLPNQFKIGSVIGGREGHISLQNLGEIEADIGGWIVEIPGKIFTVPQFTKIGPKSEVALANAVTGLLLETNMSTGVGPLYDKDTTIMVRYPNGSLALEWKSEKPKPNPVAAAVALASPVFQETADEKKPVLPESEGDNTEPAKTERKNPRNYIFLSLALFVSAAAGLGFIAVKKFLKS